MRQKNEDTGSQKRPARIDRRVFLRGAAYSLAVPFLPSIATRSALAKVTDATPKAKRIVCAGTQLGFYKPDFFASQGNPRILQPLEASGLGRDFTTISGLDHKGPTGNGHELCHTLLTGTVNKTVSLDQYVAPVLGADTRYESMQLCAGEYTSRAYLSFTPNGLPMPVTIYPSVVYSRIYGPDSLSLKRQSYVIGSGRSLLDDLTGEASSMLAKANSEDRDKLNEYLTSVRDVELKLQRRQKWLERPFPEPDSSFELPKQENIASAMMLDNEDLMWDLMALAIKNDSCRVFTLTIPISNGAIYLGDELMKSSYHNYSHHGKKKDRVESLVAIERRHMAGAARFMKTLKETKDVDGRSLLDSTITLIGSGMGDPSKHRRVNYPLLVAGGGLKHSRHIECSTVEHPNEMACDLYVTLLQRMGFETGQFSTSESDLNRALA